MTCLSLSWQSSQVPDEGSPPVQMMQFIWHFYSLLCFRVALVPPCTSSGGCFRTSSLKLHWKSGTLCLDKRNRLLITCQGRAKSFSKHHSSFSCLNLQAISWWGLVLRASQLCSQIFCLVFTWPCMNHSPAWVLRWLYYKSSNSLILQGWCPGTTAGSLCSAPSYTCAPVFYRSLGKTLPKDSMSTPFCVFDHWLMSDRIRRARCCTSWNTLNAVVSFG